MYQDLFYVHLPMYLDLICFKCSKQKKWFLTTNSDFTIPISLQPNVVDKGLYNKVAKTYMGLENLS